MPTEMEAILNALPPAPVDGIARPHKPPADAFQSLIIAGISTLPLGKRFVGKNFQRIMSNDVFWKALTQ